VRSITWRESCNADHRKPDLQFATCGRRRRARRARLGITFTGSWRNATRRYQIGGGSPVGECPPTGFGRRRLSTSVRLSSSTPSAYRQRIANIPVILQVPKISTKYVGNSVENLKPVEIGSLPGLSFLSLCLNFRQSSKLLICFTFLCTTTNFSRSNTYPSNFSRFHSIVILPVNKSPRGPNYRGSSGTTSDGPVETQGLPMDGMVHLPGGLASVETRLKRG
jgi:hypothetical protein